MNKGFTAVFFLLVILFLLPVSIFAQTGSSTSLPQSEVTVFPQWAKDLRRAEIIAFGSYPFMYFFTTFGFDLYRCATHDWNSSYAPWPFTADISVDQTMSEKKKVLLMAAAGSVLLSVVDFVIERYKRNREEMEMSSLPPGTPIIIRRPLHEDTGTGSSDPAIPMPGAEETGTNDGSY